MGSFAASIFNLLLGWIRGLVGSLWELINSQEARDGLSWLGDNWLWLVITIAVAGLVIDYVIWFIRWRPYYVWRSWWRRLTRRGENEAQEEYQPPYDEAADEFYDEAYPPEEYAYPQEVYEEPVHPGLTETGIQETLGLQPEPEKPQTPVRQRRSRREPAPFSRVRSGISQMASRIDFMGLSREDEDAEDYSYMPPPPAVDKDQAFNAPVYPAYWRKDREDER